MLSKDLRKIFYVEFHETRPVAAELFYADRRTHGRTDMAQLTIAFRNFGNTPKSAESACVRTGRRTQ
jgi:hypothetical protein